VPCPTPVVPPGPPTLYPSPPLPVCGRWKHFMRFVVSIRLQFDSSRQTFWDWVRAATMPEEWGLCLAFEALSGLFSVLLSFCACCCSALLCIISSSDCAPESEADRKLLPPSEPLASSQISPLISWPLNIWPTYLSSGQQVQQLKFNSSAAVSHNSFTCETVQPPFADRVVNIVINLLRPDDLQPARQTHFPNQIFKKKKKRK